MSIGLGDLNKKKRSASKPREEKQAASALASAWPAPRVTRPWDSELESRETSSMNEEVLDLAPLLNIDLSEKTFLGQLQERLVVIEDRVDRFVVKPLAGVSAKLQSLRRRP